MKSHAGNDSNPDVTVVIIHRKGESCRDTLESLERQTYRNFKEIIVEDSEARGQSWARNAGFKQVETKYVLFSDNDILWDPDALETMLKTLQNNPEASYTYGGYDLVRDENVIGRLCYMPWSARRLKKWRKGNFISTMTLVRTEHFPGFDENLRRLEDWDVWLTMLRHKRKGVYCGKRIFVTRFRNDGITYGSESISDDEAIRVLKKKHQSRLKKVLEGIFQLFRWLK
jgi:glycosyltransferase involved in cell wall biosynthesis